MFWGVVGLSTAASIALFAVIYSYWRYFPHTKHQRRVADLKALRDLLLYHVDDLEDILEALQKNTELGPGSLRFLSLSRKISSSLDSLAEVQSACCCRMSCSRGPESDADWCSNHWTGTYSHTMRLDAERVGLAIGMLGTSTKMGREEFAALVQSSIQDCQVHTVFQLVPFNSICAASFTQC